MKGSPVFEANCSYSQCWHS